MKLERDRSTIICLIPLRQWGHEQTQVAWALDQEQQKAHCLFVNGNAVLKQMLEHPTCQISLHRFEQSNLPISTCLPGSCSSTKSRKQRTGCHCFHQKCGKMPRHRMGGMRFRNLFRFSYGSMANDATSQPLLVDCLCVICWSHIWCWLLVRNCKAHHLTTWPARETLSWIAGWWCCRQTWVQHPSPSSLFHSCPVSGNSRVQGIYDQSKAGQTLAEALGGVALVVESRLPLPSDRNTQIQYIYKTQRSATIKRHLGAGPGVWKLLVHLYQIFNSLHCGKQQSWPQPWNS